MTDITNANDKPLADVSGQKNSVPWVYSDVVKEHFFSPQNFVAGDPPEHFDGLGMVGSPACGDMLKVWLVIDHNRDTITDCKWQTFGCGSAIAATSMMSVMVTENGGMTIDHALQLTPQAMLARLDGLPARKVHCSVLGDKALHAAINDYFRRTNQLDRMEKENARIIDPTTHITDHDVEDAVLHGARTVEDVCTKLNVDMNNPQLAVALEQLVRFYTEKYYG